MIEKNEKLLDMTTAFISMRYLKTYLRLSRYQEFPSITNQLVVAYSYDTTLDGQSQTLLIYSSGRILRTRQSIDTLFDNYGLLHQIEAWAPWKKAMSYLMTGSKQLYPYVTIFSCFAIVHPGCILNLEYVSGYKKAPYVQQQTTHTHVHLPLGGILEVELGRKSFRKKYLEGGKLLLALRQYDKLIDQEREEPSLYHRPPPVNPFMIWTFNKSAIPIPTLTLSAVSEALYYFSELEPRLLSIELTQELFDSYKPFTRQLIKEHLIDTNRKKVTRL